MARTKTKVGETLQNFLFNKIESDPDYQQWAKSYQIPDYITDNLHPTKTLREYQENALKHFIWLFDHDRRVRSTYCSIWRLERVRRW